jgi:hypothetical protein
VVQAAAAFSEGHVEADGFRIRYMEAGHGPALLHLHGAGGLRLTPGHDLLRRHFRVIAFERIRQLGREHPHAGHAGNGLDDGAGDRRARP